MSTGGGKGLNAAANEFQPGGSPTARGGYTTNRGAPDMNYANYGPTGFPGGPPAAAGYHGGYPQPILPAFNNHNYGHGPQGYPHPGAGIYTSQQHHHHPHNLAHAHGHFGPRQPNAAQFGAHSQAWNAAMMTNVKSMHHPPVPTIRHWRAIILIMGAPMSGKKTIGSLLAKELGFVHISTDAIQEGHWDERFEIVDKALDNLQAKGFVISGYGAGTDADLYYLFHVIESKEQRLLRVSLVVYLDYPYTDMQTRIATKEEPLSSSTMMLYATAYELCWIHFSAESQADIFCLLQVTKNGVPRTSEDLLKEVMESATKSLGLIQGPTPPTQTPKAPPLSGDKWTLVDDFRLFRKLLLMLDKCLDRTQIATGVFPLRNPGSELNYNKFSRHFHQLQQYEVLLVTSGQRALIFKIGNTVYALTERCTCIYKLEGEPETFSRHSARTDDELVFALDAELCTIEHDGRIAAHILLRDVLYFNNSTTKRLPWAARRAIVQDEFREGSDQFILRHVVQHISFIDELLKVAHDIEHIVVGVRFEHPYGYSPSFEATDVDPRLLTWSSGEAPLATLRVWNSKEQTKTTGGQSVAVYIFDLLVVEDHSGYETPLQDIFLPVNPSKPPQQPKPERVATIEVLNDLVQQTQLNDGHLVECRYIRTVQPPVVKGPGARAAKQEWYPAGSWAFVRRRNDLMYPHYASTVRDHMMSPPWSRQELIAACKEIPHDDPVEG